MGAGLCTAEPLFDFAPHLFDGVEVRGVGWKEKHLGSGLFYQGESLFAFVGSKVIHHHDVSLAQGGTKDPTDILPEHLCVGGSFNSHAGIGTIQADRSQDGGGVPMAMGCAGMDALAAHGAAPQPSHVGFGSRLVQEDQPRRVEAPLAPPPRPAGLRDVGTVLLAGSERLFFKVSPIFSKA